jgi:TonB family protein
MLSISLLALAEATVGKKEKTEQALLPALQTATISSFVPVGRSDSDNSARPAPPPAPSEPSRGPKAPVPKSNPASWATPDDYPREALNERREGTTTFLLDVNEVGRVTDCTVTASSGFFDLDTTTCIKVFIRSRFEPALDKDNKPTAGTWSSRVRWEIPHKGFGAIVSLNNIDESFPRPPKSMRLVALPVKKKDYPPEALEQKRQGITIVGLDITTQGMVENCKVASSSGHQDLDAQSCAIARREGRFAPALDYQGKPTAGKVSQKIEWSLDKEAGKSFTVPTILEQPVKSSSYTQFSYVAQADGSIRECIEKKELTGAPVSPSIFCDNVAENSFKPFADEKGNPVSRRVKFITEVKVEPIE